MLRRSISIVLFCLYIAAVAYLCFAEPTEMPQLPETWLGLPADKLAHFAMFVPFPPLAYLIFESKTLTIFKKIIILLSILAIGVGTAAGTEQIQAHLAYRSADYKDFIADMAGLTAGAAVTIIYMLIRRKK